MRFRLTFVGSIRHSRAVRYGAITLLAGALGLCLSPLARADAKSALPPAVSGFKLTKPAQVFDPPNLENHIDGEAEAVKRYDFKACAYGEYAPGGKGNQLITVDVFQFGAPLDAYGYYSGQRNASATFVKVGAEGYRESSPVNDLNFWKGPYYVRIAITAANAPPQFQQELMPLALAVAAKLPGPTTTPAIVNLLPSGREPRSEKYMKSNIAAQSYLTNGVLARYPSAGQRAELFICVYPSPAAAKQAYTRYEAYLTKPSSLAMGAKPTPVKGLGESAFSERTRYTGNVVVALKGKDILAVRQAKDPASAEKVVRAAAANVK